MFKKSIYLALFFAFVSCSAMEEEKFYDALPPEEDAQLPARGTESFIDETLKESKIKSTNQRVTTSKSIQDLPSEILLKIFNDLTNASTAKDAIQSIINFSATEKVYSNFVKFWLPGLLKTIIDIDKKFTVQDFLSTGILPIILIESFKTYFDKLPFSQMNNEIQNLINAIKKDVKDHQLCKKNQYLLANLFFLGLLKDETKNNLLFDSASSGSLDAINILLEINTNPNAINKLKFDSTTFFTVDQNEFYTFFNKPVAIYTAYDEPNIMGGFMDFGYTALMLIVLAEQLNYTQKINAIKLLLKKGADINKQSKLKGHTPLMLAVLKKDKEMVKFLLNNGADKEIADYCGHTALQIAQKFDLK